MIILFMIQVYHNSYALQEHFGNILKVTLVLCFVLLLCYHEVMTIAEFVSALSQKFEGAVFSVSAGRRYTRILIGDSVYCFIDADGNIYKAASWKAASKGIRSTLAAVDMNSVDRYGSWLYRSR